MHSVLEGLVKSWILRIGKLTYICTPEPNRHEPVSLPGWRNW